jgi:hypothetical protein
VDETETALASARQFEKQADPNRVTADVASLARSPRGRRHSPQAMARAEERVVKQLSDAGWIVTAKPFQRRWVFGVSEAGGTTSILARLRLFRRLDGVNLIAELPSAQPTSSSRQTLVIAHLDTVAISPGADDNASGVAVLLECARLLATLANPPAVKLAVVDMEELGKIGSRTLARDPDFVRDIDAVICLESVGTFSSEPLTQKLGGLGLLFRNVSRHVRANQNRGDFVLAVCRKSTSPIARRIAACAGGLQDPLPVLLARDPRPDGWRGRLVTWLFPLLINLDRSDHAPFWGRGVPALMLTTTAPFRNRHYHQESDQPEEVDCRRLTTLAAALAGALTGGAAGSSSALPVAPRLWRPRHRGYRGPAPAGP